jgi:hypothetical protein
MPILNLNLQKTCNGQYLTAIRLMRELVNQLVIFFLPIYYFVLHFPFMERFNFSVFHEGILNVAMIYIATRLIAFLSAIPIAKILVKLGIRQGLIVGHLFYVCFILCLYLSKTNIYFVLLATVFNGLQLNLFGNSYRYALSRCGNQAQMGANLGIINFLLNLLTAIAPALGGLIIFTLDYPTLFLVGLVIILLGVIFSVLLDELKVKDNISYREFFIWLKAPTFKRLALTFAGRSFNDATISLWVLYMFILLGSPKGLGVLYSLSLFLALFISYVTNALINKKVSRQRFFFSGSLLSVFWLLRTFVTNIWSIAVLNAFDKLAANFHWLVFDHNWIFRGKGREALSYFTYREMIYSFISVLFWLLIALMFYFFVFAWKGLFVLAATGILLTLLIKEHRLEEID